MDKVKIAAIQMNSYADLSYNMELAEKLIAEAAAQGAKFVLLPEYFYWMGEPSSKRLNFAETSGDGSLQYQLADYAKRYSLWLSAGTIALKSAKSDRIYNANLTFNPDGECIGRYDKIHLFGFDDGQERYRESDVLLAGDSVVSVSTPFATIRPSVCYDLRFPELYRAAPDYQIATVPAAFTYKTGLAHWLVLLRSRAIENQCYVVGAAQWGEHQGGHRTFGHSVIIDPWGQVLDELKEGNGVVCAEFNPLRLANVREQLPALAHRRLSD